MRIFKFGHSCLLAEHDGVRLLFDPGSFSHGFEDLTGLEGVLVTHQHADHLDLDRLPALLRANPSAAVYADRESAARITAAGFDVTPVEAGDTLTIAGAQVRAVGGDHETIHPDIPGIPNIGYLFAGLLHPGDEFVVPDVAVDVLALPAAAPWSKLSETVEYLRAVAPRAAVPVHDAVIAPAAKGVYLGRFSELGPDGTTVTVVPDGESRDF